jgi:ELWxxDGT repeat protein
MRRVRDINPGADPAHISRLTAVSDTLFFTADDGVTGRELWRSDGTISGTLQVMDLTPGPASSQLGALVAADGELLFTRHLTSTAELWRSDGTAAGTSLVAETPDSWMFPLTVVDGGLYFFTRTGDNPVKLWHMSDSRATPVMLKEFPFAAIYSEVKVAVHDGQFFFTVREPEAKIYLWKSDGTAAGTVRVADGSGQPLSWWSIDTLKSIGDSLFMRADDGKHGNELWIYQSDPDRAFLWKDIAAEGAGSFPDHLTVVGEHIFFTADDSVHGREIWHSAPQVIPPTYRVYLTMIRR